MIGRAPALVALALTLGVLPAMFAACKKEEPAPAPAASASTTDDDDDKAAKKKKKKKGDDDDDDDKKAEPAPSPSPAVVDAGPPATGTAKKPVGTTTGTTMTKTDGGTAPPMFTIPTGITIPSTLPTIPGFPPPAST
jgi:hypothetical protein